jgi:hypothetical protein
MQTSNSVNNNGTCFMSKAEGISFDRTRYYEGMRRPDRNDHERVTRVIQRAGDKQICYASGTRVDMNREYRSDIVQD